MMKKIIIIVLSLILFSCSDDDVFFSSVDSFSVQVQNEIDYYRLMNGLPIVEYSLFIEEQALSHAQYIKSIGVLNYDNQADRFTKIQDSLSVQHCKEFFFKGPNDGKWVLDKLLEVPEQNEAILTATFFGVSAVKSKNDYFIVIIFAL